MNLTRLHPTPLAWALAAILPVAGCHSSTQTPTQTQTPNQSQPSPSNPAGQQASGSGSAPGTMPPSPPAQSAPSSLSGTQAQSQVTSQSPQQREPSAIPAGTRIVVALGQTLSSRTAQPGESFTATVRDPVRVDGQVLIRAGAPATGTVIDAKALGHFAGGALLAIRLDSIRAEGRTYRVATSTVERVEKGKGRRTAELTGGVGGFGAILGAVAGGGRGALIGGLAGAGTGATGSALTGNHELVIPAESYLTFRLERTVPLG